MANEALKFCQVDNWVMTTLGEVVKQGGGSIQTGPFGSQLHASDYVSMGIPSIMPVNIGENRVIEKNIARITLRDAERLSRHRVQIGDIIYSRRGDVERRALIREEQEGWLCGTGCLKIRFGSGVVDPLYASYYLGHPEVRSWIVQHAVGATMPNLNTGIVESIPFVLPPFPEQQAIASILGALDDKIELNRQRNRTLEAMARALFQSWFVDFDPVKAKAAGKQPPGLNPGIAALFPDSFAESDLGLIPSNWNVSSLADIMDIEGGTQPPASTFSKEPKSGFVRLVQIRDYETDSHATYIQDSTKWRKCFPEDIMIARYGASVARICWGLEGAYNVALVKAVPSKPFFREYLRTFLLSDYFQVRLIGMSNRSAQAGFNKGDIASFRIIVPPESIASVYQKHAWQIRSRILEANKECNVLSSLRDCLLPKLISGELRIPDAEKIVARTI